MANSSEYENSTSATDVTLWNAYSTSMAIILAGINIFLAITASLGNALILIALHKVTSIFPPTKLLFRCLAVTDLLVGLISQPLYLTFLFPKFTAWNVNVAITRASEFFFSLLPAVSLLTSSAISVDRLLALLLGLRYRHTVTLRRVWLVILCFWLISALQATGSTCSDECPQLDTIANTLFGPLLMLSLLVSVFSYAKIFITLRYRQVQVHGNSQQGQRPNGGGNQLNIARYKKTVYSIAWVQLALLICYIPYIVLRFLGLLGMLDKQLSTEISILLELFVTLLYVNSSLNPALYCWRIKDVRQEVKNIVRKIFRCF
ncbi:unnamed protein product [Porites lobata]|uniref:G-protein coupled receptors family 1 profile domain-containing protein n=1 Tax=Porites lobata TaxID=104759 RepID=A0ABN8Q4G8_9CNID|nr:unnamed protein product [Porites lobata]